ncbi:MAG: T9SS type A sorting domain-containing protein [Bacteroidetes bacterium]|nr:T9SS type A sorting domain-containing protein [Bacteroidota bacterium]
MRNLHKQVFFVLNAPKSIIKLSIHFIAFFFFTYSFSLHAQPDENGEEFPVNTFSENHQEIPRVAMDASGDFAVVWQSAGQDGSGMGIFGQCFHSNGNVNGQEFRANTFTEEEQGNPAIAMNANGDFVIVWQSTEQDGSGAGIYGQRFQSNGSKEGAEFQVNSFTSEDQAYPKVAMDDQGDFVVVWQSAQQDGSGQGIFGQRFNHNGSKFGSEFQINTYSLHDQKMPVVAMGGAGNFVVVWQSDWQDGMFAGIFGQMYYADGSLNGSEFQINTYFNNNQKLPDVTMVGNGDFIVVWESYGQDGVGAGIFGRRFFSDGSINGNEFQINSYTTDGQNCPSIAADMNGDFIVSWHSTGQECSKKGVYAQAFNDNGMPSGFEYQVNTYTLYEQEFPATAMSDAGDFVIVWSSKGQDGSGLGTFGQRYFPPEPASPIELTSCGGNIRTEAGIAIEQVQVEIDDQLSSIIETNNNGEYSFSGIPAGNDYAVTAVKDINHSNGISTLDQIIILRHILGNVPMTSPYKLIAADVNNSHSVSMADLIQIRKVILGVETQFSQNTSWRFIDADYDFPQPANPFFEDFPETCIIGNLMEDELEADFIGIKIGDVNEDASANMLWQADDRNTNTVLHFELDDQLLKVGQQMEIPFRIDEDIELLGAQFTLEFDSDIVSVINLNPGNFMQGQQFGWNNTGDGRITINWFSAESVEVIKEDVVFSLELEVKKPVRLSEIIDLTSSITQAEAYDGTGNMKSLGLKFLKNSHIGQGLQMLPCTPNPFHDFTQIQFILPEAKNVNLSVFSANGRLLLTQEGSFSKGHNQIQLNASQLPTHGVLLYRLETDTESAIGKVVFMGTTK